MAKKKKSRPDDSNGIGSNSQKRSVSRENDSRKKRNKTDNSNSGAGRGSPRRGGGGRGDPQPHKINQSHSHGGRGRGRGVFVGRGRGVFVGRGRGYLRGRGRGDLGGRSRGDHGSRGRGDLRGRGNQQKRLIPTTSRSVSGRTTAQKQTLDHNSGHGRDSQQKRTSRSKSVNSNSDSSSADSQQKRTSCSKPVHSNSDSSSAGIRGISRIFKDISEKRHERILTEYKEITNISEYRFHQSFLHYESLACLFEENEPIMINDSVVQMALTILQDEYKETTPSVRVVTSPLFAQQLLGIYLDHEKKSFHFLPAPKHKTLKQQFARFIGAEDKATPQSFDLQEAVKRNDIDTIMIPVNIPYNKWIVVVIDFVKKKMKCKTSHMDDLLCGKDNKHPNGKISKYLDIPYDDKYHTKVRTCSQKKLNSICGSLLFKNDHKNKSDALTCLFPIVALNHISKFIFEALGIKDTSSWKLCVKLDNEYKFNGNSALFCLSIIETRLRLQRVTVPYLEVVDKCGRKSLYLYLTQKMVEITTTDDDSDSDGDAVQVIEQISLPDTSKVPSFTKHLMARMKQDYNVDDEFLLQVLRQFGVIVLTEKPLNDSQKYKEKDDNTSGSEDEDINTETSHESKDIKILAYAVVEFNHKREFEDENQTKRQYDIVSCVDALFEAENIGDGTDYVHAQVYDYVEDTISSSLTRDERRLIKTRLWNLMNDDHEEVPPVIDDENSHSCAIIHMYSSACGSQYLQYLFPNASENLDSSDSEPEDELERGKRELKQLIPIKSRKYVQDRINKQSTFVRDKVPMRYLMFRIVNHIRNMNIEGCNMTAIYFPVWDVFPRNTASSDPITPTPVTRSHNTQYRTLFGFRFDEDESTANKQPINSFSVTEEYEWIYVPYVNSSSQDLPSRLTQTQPVATKIRLIGQTLSYVARRIHEIKREGMESRGMARMESDLRFLFPSNENQVQSMVTYLDPHAVEQIHIFPSKSSSAPTNEPLLLVKNKWFGFKHVESMGEVSLSVNMKRQVTKCVNKMKRTNQRQVYTPTEAGAVTFLSADRRCVWLSFRSMIERQYPHRLNDLLVLERKYQTSQFEDMYLFKSKMEGTKSFRELLNAMSMEIQKVKYSGNIFEMLHNLERNHLYVCILENIHKEKIHAIGIETFDGILLNDSGRIVEYNGKESLSKCLGNVTCTNIHFLSKINLK